MVKKRRQPPAKIRYDKIHPVISIRVNQKLKQKLEEIRETSGKSVGDVLREALKVQSRSTKNAYGKGYRAAKDLYGVEYKCSVCGGNIWITTSRAKRDVAEYMRDRGWAHSNCIG